MAMSPLIRSLSRARASVAWESILSSVTQSRMLSNVPSMETEALTSGGGSAGASLRALLAAQLNEMKEAGTFKEERIITSPQGSAILLKQQQQQQQQRGDILNLCANNYLGLANHPRLVKAAADALDTHGFGLASVRFICGTQDLHKELERKLAEFHGTEAAILYPSCFDANAGFFEAVLTADDAVISDELNHASIIDGIRLCKAQRHRYRHMDMEDLEAKLKATQESGARIRLIATDGVFSMDGHIAPLKEICQLAQQYGALVFVDDCHSTGFLGPTGRGTDEHCGVQGQVDIINSTLGKAMGGATGGYTTGPAEVIALLRQKARPYLFSNTLAPSVAAAGIAALELLSESTELCEKLQRNTRYFRDGIQRAGFSLRAGSPHPIVPIMLGEARLAQVMAERLLTDHGIYVIGFSYPVVPKGAARIRVQISAAHDEAQLDRAIAAFKQVGSELGVLK
eukprot:TRINITY_DN1004_c0_g5_i1.p1 TRINITY_DN1004_c0_g5~~TRINITY_DN1004_c0_g5_i1.p1  ORF type:complete len:457 (-),score=85.42 TRINITY_DN1004_c0_g5_i1:545-1915(-)